MLCCWWGGKGGRGGGMGVGVLFMNGQGLINDFVIDDGESNQDTFFMP